MSVVENPRCDNCGKYLVGFDAKAYAGIEVFCSLKCNQEYKDEESAHEDDDIFSASNEEMG